MAEQPVKILDGNTFVVSDSAGDIEASSTDPRGLFAFDTRPSLPTTLGHLALLDIPGRWGRVDAYGRGKFTVDTTHGVSVGAAAR